MVMMARMMSLGLARAARLARRITRGITRGLAVLPLREYRLDIARQFLCRVHYGRLPVGSCGRRRAALSLHQHGLDVRAELLERGGSGGARSRRRRGASHTAAGRKRRCRIRAPRLGTPFYPAARPRRSGRCPGADRGAGDGHGVSLLLVTRTASQHRCQPNFQAEHGFAPEPTRRAWPKMPTGTSRRQNLPRAPWRQGTRDLPTGVRKDTVAARETAPGDGRRGQPQSTGPEDKPEDRPRG
jgi:hypothetical protein